MYDTETVRKLNNEFRQSLTGGRVVATRGVLALDDMPAILDRVRRFNDFTEANDPFGECEFGSLTHERPGSQSTTIFWKIDYFNSDLSAGSEDPSDPSVTTRVLTIMLAEDY